MINFTIIEQKVIEINENKTLEGLMPPLGFIFEDIIIANPYYTGLEVEVEPLEYYGDAYVKWLNKLAQYENIVDAVLVGKVPLVVLRVDTTYTVIYGKMHSTGTINEIQEAILSIAPIDPLFRKESIFEYLKIEEQR